MAKYQLTRDAYVVAKGALQARIYRKGQVIDFDGVPSKDMSPLDAAARDACAARQGEQEDAQAAG
ncbi:MAG: hypothetical protein GEU95_17630 [Rhizobiales bacterium]|nr:hypothetical protein [Hyphomicrobiales bacterium]